MRVAVLAASQTEGQGAVQHAVRSGSLALKTFPEEGIGFWTHARQTSHVVELPVRHFVRGGDVHLPPKRMEG